MKLLSNKALLLWIDLSIIFISQVLCGPTALSFKPKEIVTYDLNGHCAHAHDKNTYQMKKFEIKIKEENKNSISSFFSNMFKYVLNQNEEEEKNNTQNQNRTALENPFEVQYQCNCEDIYCDRIKNSFEKIPSYFSRALDIYTPIKLRLNIFSFSESEYRSNSSALAITTPPPYLVLKDSEKGWPFSYPLTLIKQLNTDLEIQYAPDEDDYDIDIDINTDKMGDFEYFTAMLAHEILHGMGIYYLIQPLSMTIPDFNNGNDMVIPPINIIETEDELDSSKKIEFKTFLPPSIYERNFVDLEKMIENNGSLSEDYYFFNENYYGAFKDIPLNFTIHQPIQDNIEEQSLQNFNETIYNWKGTSLAQDFYHTASYSNSVGFLTQEGDILKIQTYDNEYSSDLFHISTPYYCESKEKCTIEEETDHHLLDFGPNFVMLSKYYLMELNAEEKIEHCAPNNTYGLLGDGLVHMLTTMGWTEKNHEPNDKLYYIVMEDELNSIELEDPVNPTNDELKLITNQLDVASLTASDAINTIKNLGNTLIYIYLLSLICLFLI
ncbi:hypothetical protein BCR32DRAFT_247999 [Anaeromyces robustus]|uniref:Peptidase M43 pregnancy-associated plasma-A domain-containing protein n=1 Tax=Anaeromyces robustus TaxID=1754192 RepID=A0A1Y1WVP0_9FUNG|nr:hypothetical protein BCR32DRAFT_247999 [Anaeromyces robustus]|eukprot:ORX77378.1 hypothetical protein BCR32DRAFT_247999 [Anaeromyces robustus]